MGAPVYRLVWTDTFLRTAKKFLKRHRELEPVLESFLEKLEAGPNNPGLKLHPLKGRLSGKHAASLTYEYRVILILEITDKEIILLDIGSHDETYRDKK